MALVAGNDNESQLPSSLLELLSSPSASSDGPDLSTPAAKAYLDRLITLGLDNLVQEPGIIDHERSAVDLELVNLCYREYPTFTSVHKCSSAVGAAFDDFAKSLGQLIESIPALEEECRDFGRGTASIQSARRKAVLLQDHENKLIDVLEIPQLMETCVRNGYYQEALELSTHVADLRQKYATTVMDDIAEETSSILQLMTAQLLGILREPVKLPALLKAVGYLRRLQDLDESQLGLVFLSSRLQNYRARLVEIEKDRAEPVRYLRRYIDLFREHVFDIISQYTTIFSAVAGDQLASFASLCVEDLAQLVQRYIPRIASDSASMSSILVQLGYCSLSFARAGLDFSSLLVDPFKSSILYSYDQAVSSAASLLVDTLALDSQGVATPANLVISAQHLQQVLVDPYSPPRLDRAHTDEHIPPAVLAHFPPLAHFLNAHLTSLNALRLLAPFQSMSALLASQTKSIQMATTSILDYCEQAVSTEFSGELSRTASRSRHSRTNSTPRAHLLRRNTETQLSAETLVAKRRETKRVCVAFADAWVTTCAFLHQAMCLILETDPTSGRASETLEQLRLWIAENGEKDDSDGPPDQDTKANGDRSEPMIEVDESAEADHPPRSNGHVTAPQPSPHTSLPSSHVDTTGGPAEVPAEPTHVEQPAVTSETLPIESNPQLETSEVQPDAPLSSTPKIVSDLERTDPDETAKPEVLEDGTPTSSSNAQSPKAPTPAPVTLERSDIPTEASEASSSRATEPVKPSAALPKAIVASDAESSHPSHRPCSRPTSPSLQSQLDAETMVSSEDRAPLLPNNAASESLPDVPPASMASAEEPYIRESANVSESHVSDPSVSGTVPVVTPTTADRDTNDPGRGVAEIAAPETVPEVASDIAALEETAIATPRPPTASAESPSSLEIPAPVTEANETSPEERSPSRSGPDAPETVLEVTKTRREVDSVQDTTPIPESTPEAPTPEEEEAEGDDASPETAQVGQAGQGGSGAKGGKKKKKKKGKK